jgi:hypothetical protein
MTLKKAVLISCAILALLLCGGIAYGYYWSHHYGRALVAKSNVMMQAGRAFGAKSDNIACLEEAKTRFQSDNTIRGKIGAGMFLSGCLKSSAPSPGFCDSVPPPSDILKCVKWRLTAIETYHLSSDAAPLLQVVEKYCDECRKRGKAAK